VADARFLYDAATGRYRYAASGRLVPEARIRAAVDEVLAATTRQMVAWTQQVQAARLPLIEWERQMQGELRRAANAVAIVASGGRGSLDYATRGLLGAWLSGQYVYLGGFVRDIEAGRQPRDGRLLSRAQLYGEAPRGLYQEIVRRQARGRGLEQERSVLGPAERHCSQCPDLAARGWQPIGTLPPPGSRACLSRCKCYLEFRLAPPEEAA